MILEVKLWSNICVVFQDIIYHFIQLLTNLREITAYFYLQDQKSLDIWIYSHNFIFFLEIVLVLMLKCMTKKLW